MAEISIEIIKSMCQKEALRWTNHMLIKLIQRNISIDDIVCALMNGEIIEQYPNDYPYPSCLTLGLSVHKKHLHVVCGVGDKELWLITAYYPDSGKWKTGFKIRKEI
ncbi:MAG: DUF4258 domain-containing protein [Sporomusaceae bacterium]|jgi:hypothetical protein|nr:DUF4258 domain-containing protein [Sporomusaceae bacterium]